VLESCTSEQYRTGNLQAFRACSVEDEEIGSGISSGDDQQLVDGKEEEPLSVMV
jgi:hypothetical protein